MIAPDSCPRVQGTVNDESQNDAESDQPGEFWGDNGGYEIQSSEHDSSPYIPRWPRQRVTIVDLLPGYDTGGNDESRQHDTVTTTGAHGFIPNCTGAPAPIPWNPNTCNSPYLILSGEKW